MLTVQIVDDFSVGLIHLSCVIFDVRRSYRIVPKRMTKRTAYNLHWNIHLACDRCPGVSAPVACYILLDRVYCDIIAVSLLFSYCTKVSCHVVCEGVCKSRSRLLQETEKIVLLSALMPGYYLHCLRLNLDVVQLSGLVALVAYTAIL